MTANPTREQIWAESRRRLIPGTVVGSLIEWYDIAVYGQAAALVFNTLFFPKFSDTSGHVAAFATFGVGYFARPLGEVIFGHVGDKYGPRFSLVCTLVLMGAATVFIGLLPTYSSVGLLAAVLLVTCRLLQGLGVGAEYVGAVTMVAEFSPAKRRGYFASLPAGGVFLGIGLAAAVTAGVSALPDAQLMSWGWRVPFLLSFIVVGIGLVIRLRVPESPVFTELKQARARTRLPPVTMVKAMPKRFLLAMVANGVLAFNIYVVQTYSLSYLAGKHVTKSVSLVAVAVRVRGRRGGDPDRGEDVRLQQAETRLPGGERALRDRAVPVLLAARHPQRRADPGGVRAGLRQLPGDVRIQGRLLRRACSPRPTASAGSRWSGRSRAPRSPARPR